MLIDEFGKKHKIVAVSDAMNEVFEQVKLLARSSVRILIKGETGTGKELIAKAIHEESNRKGKFIAINASVIPRELFEAHLFGTIKGSYTGSIDTKNGYLKEADGGTLFLDEIAALSSYLQQKLLRVFQEKKFSPVGSTKETYSDFRLLTATNEDIDSLVVKGKFREDFLYRILGSTIYLPPLRERSEDIPHLCMHFLDKYLDKSNKGFDVKLSINDFATVSRNKFYGNVRELESFMERVISYFQNGKLHDAKVFKNIIRKELKKINKAITREKSPEIVSDLLNVSLSEALTAYLKFHKNQSKAAEDLGISILTLMRRIRTCYIIYGIEYGDNAVINVLKYAPQNSVQEKDTVSDYVSRIRECIKFAKKSEKDRQKEINKPYLIKYHEQVLKLIEVFE